MHGGEVQGVLVPSCLTPRLGRNDFDALGGRMVMEPCGAPRIVAGAELHPSHEEHIDMVMPATRGWTTRDVRALIDEERAWPRYELIAGELLVTPAPGTPHQLSTAELLRLITDYVDAHGVGVACTSPADLELQSGTITQPDMFVIRAHSRGPHADAASWEGIASLLLAVEVISPSSGRQDRVTKRDFYLDADVAEYWVVDMDARLIERWTPERVTPQLERGTFAWAPAGAPEPLLVDVPDLSARIERKVRLIAATSRA